MFPSPLGMLAHSDGWVVEELFKEALALQSDDVRTALANKTMEELTEMFTDSSSITNWELRARANVGRISAETLGYILHTVLHPIPRTPDNEKVERADAVGIKSGRDILEGAGLTPEKKKATPKKS
jgi:hypothetical protein